MLVRRRAGVSLHGVAQRVHARVGRDLRRAGDGQRRVDDGVIRRAQDAGLDVVHGVVDDAHGRHLAAGAGGGGDQDELDLPPCLPGHEILRDRAGVLRQHRDGLGAVQAAAAADAHQHLIFFLLEQGACQIHLGVGGVRLHLVKNVRLDPCGTHRVRHLVHQSGAADARVADEQNRAASVALDLFGQGVCGADAEEDGTKL